MIRVKSAQRGFTLLELLVALSIFAILSTITYTGLSRILTLRADVEQRTERLHQLQLCYRLMGRDLAQYIERDIRNEYGDLEEALLQGGEEEGLMFTRSGWLNPASQARSNLQRTAYRLEEDKLVRLTWAVLDRAQDSEAYEHVLLEKVKRLEIRLLDDNNEWHTQWPPLDRAAAPTGTTGAPPKAAEVILELEDAGELRWLFRLAA